MKELTLKQLYGYSIMKWECIFDKVINIEIVSKCAFCFDKGRNVECFKKCRINKYLCNESGTSGLFAKINNIESELISRIIELRRLLKLEYNKL